jgi:hypothetical protein
MLYFKKNWLTKAHKQRPPLLKLEEDNVVIINIVITQYSNDTATSQLSCHRNRPLKSRYDLT